MPAHIVNGGLCRVLERSICLESFRFGDPSIRSPGSSGTGCIDFETSVTVERITDELCRFAAFHNQAVQTAGGTACGDRQHHMRKCRQPLWAYRRRQRALVASVKAVIARQAKSHCFKQASISALDTTAKLRLHNSAAFHMVSVHLTLRLKPLMNIANQLCLRITIAGILVHHPTALARFKIAYR